MGSPLFDSRGRWLVIPECCSPDRGQMIPAAAADRIQRKGLAPISEQGESEGEDEAGEGFLWSRCMRLAATTS
jgi:hypothetical protein